jgi:vacuolar-type H+-ATPase subunit H
VDRGPFTEDLDLATVRSREELAEILRILHARADSPSLRDLSKWSTANGRPALAKTTISEMLAGKRLPRKGVLLAFVEACGIPVESLEPWQRAWERIAPADVARPTLQAELRQIREQAVAEAEIRATEIIAGAEAKAALMLSATAMQGPGQDLKHRMVHVWVAEERAEQTLKDAEAKAQSIITSAVEQAIAIRTESEERLERERVELGKIKTQVIEQSSLLKEINAAIKDAMESKNTPLANLATPENQAAESSVQRASTPVDKKDWQEIPEVQSVRDAYDALVSLHRIDMERQVRLAQQGEAGT